jgi:CubicO group peptidase (beta-lactamase class C family)
MPISYNFFPHSGDNIQQIQHDGNTSQSSIHVELAGRPSQYRTYYNEGREEHSGDVEEDGSTIYAIGSLTKLLISLLVTIIIDSLSYSQEARHERYRILQEEFSDPWDTRFTDLYNRFSATQIEDLPRNPKLWHVLIHVNALPPMTHDILGPDGTSFTSKESFLRAALRRAKTAHQDTQEGQSIYSNANYILVGLLIEAIAMEPLENVIEEYLFRPLGMTRTFLGAPSPSVTGVAPPYTMSVDGYRVPAKKMLYGPGDTVNAALGAYSCCRDLAILFRGLLTCTKGGQSIFNRDTIRKYLMRQVTLDKETEDGLTIFGLRTTLDSKMVGSGSLNRLVSANDISSTYRLGRKKNRRQVTAYYFAGHVEGYSSCYYFMPKWSTFVIVLTNTTGIHDSSDHISRLLLQEIFDLERYRTEDRLMSIIRAADFNKKVNVLDMSSRSAIEGRNLLVKFKAEDDQRDIEFPAPIQLDGTYFNEESELSIVIQPGSLLVNMVGTARSSTNMQFVRTGDMGLIRTGDYTIRLRPLSNVGFTIDRYDNNSWGQLSFDLTVDKGTWNVVHLERRVGDSVDKFTRKSS